MRITLQAIGDPLALETAISASRKNMYNRVPRSVTPRIDRPIFQALEKELRR